MSLLQQIPAALQGDLARVSAVFDAELASESAFVNQLAQYVERYRGKMLRPTLLLLAGKACGELTNDHYVLAAVVEMVHMATLVHDDVLDESQMRRAAPTVHRLHGNQAAVLLGDLLISHSFRLCSSLQDQQASLLVAKTAIQLCEGELMQVGARERLDLSVDEYFQIIRGKTAELVATSCKLGAQWAGADAEASQALADYGMHCGLAFQIVDDVLDVSGSTKAMGKDVGKDIAMGELTLPVLVYLNNADARARQHMHDLLQSGPGSLAAVRELLRDSESLEQAMDMARQHVRLACEALDRVPYSSTREVLVAMAEFILQRNN